MSKIRLFGTSSGYVEIAPAAAAGNNTLTAPNTVGEIIAKDAAGAIGITSMKASNVNVGAAVTITESGIEASGIGITCANINGGQIGGRRNLIINGAMQVAQRGTSYSGSSATTGYHTLDRFSIEEGGVDESGTKEQAAVTSGGAYDSGFRNCLKVTNGNQTGGAGNTDYVQIMQRIEAQNIANSGWNFSSSSSFITLSFWIKSSVAQVFSGSVRTGDGTQYSYKFDTPSISANTWTKVIKTIPGNSNLTFADDNGAGLSLYIYAFLGTTYTSSNANTETWITAATDTYSNDMTSTWWTTNDATFEITGVQLEVGSQATAFEHRSFGEELSICQRYFQRVNGGLTGVGANSTTIRANYTPPVNFRASPTISGNAPVSFNNPGINSPTQSSFNCSLQFTYNPTNVGMTLGFGNFTNATQGYTYIQWDSDNEYIDFSAEL